MVTIRENLKVFPILFHYYSTSLAWVSSMTWLHGSSKKDRGWGVRRNKIAKVGLIYGAAWPASDARNKKKSGFDDGRLELLHLQTDEAVCRVHHWKVLRLGPEKCV